jgi:hypothetical protein
MASIHHQLWIDAPLATVYEALASAEGLSRWWIPHQHHVIDGEPVISHNPGGAHGVVAMKLLEAVPGQRASPGAWRGLPHEGEPMTVVEFQHLGWDPDSEYFGFCSQAWAETLVMLRRWAESQAGGRQ